MDNKDRPAFSTNTNEEGLTKREYFAIRCLEIGQKMMGEYCCREEKRTDSQYEYAAILADKAVMMAEALLERLEKP